MLGIVLDSATHLASNGQGKNYWELYLREIAHHLGLTPIPLSPSDLEQIPPQVTGLLLGAQSANHLSSGAKQALAGWVNAGGVLVAFATQGLDDLFGIRSEGVDSQPVDEFTISAYFELRVHPLTREVHPFLFIEQRLIVLSDVVLLEQVESQEIAHLYSDEHVDLNRPLITWRRVGAGAAGYFGFDVAKTIWLLHQGKPLPRIPEGERLLRTPGLQVIGRNSTKIAYADEILLLIQNMLAFRPLPFISQLPPKDGHVPDALFYFSGDEYTGPVELSLEASNFMASLGLPYHINIASELHPMTQEQWQVIQDNGHEVSCYIWVKQGDRQFLNAQVIQAQSDSLFARFGTRPGSVLIGSTQWSGGVEPARWLAAAGASADNTFVGSHMDDWHPLMNGPFFGFANGTAFPFYFYDDAEHGNARIEILEQPIAGYELGHRASLADTNTGGRESDTLAFEDVHFAVDMAIRYHMAVNIFYHPYYIVNWPHCRAAIQEMLRYIEYRQATFVFMGNNRVAEWWKARRQSSTGDLAIAKSSIAFSTKSAWPDGIVVKVQVMPATVTQVSCDDAPVRFQIQDEFGGSWLYLAIAAGEHQIRIELDLSSIPDSVSEATTVT